MEDFARQAAGLQREEELSGKGGVLIPLIKQIMELRIEGELDAHLEEERAALRANRRNGKIAKNSRLNLERSNCKTAEITPVLFSLKQ